MPTKITSISNAHCSRLLNKLHLRASEEVSRMAGTFVSIPVYPISRKLIGRRNAAWVSTFFNNNIIYTDFIGYDSSITGVKLLVFLSHELGHVIDFMRVPPELRKQMLDAEVDKVMTDLQLRISFEVEKRAWVEGVLLLQAVKAPQFVIEMALRQRTCSLIGHLNSMARHNKKFRMREKLKKEKRNAGKQRRKSQRSKKSRSLF